MTEWGGKIFQADGTKQSYVFLTVLIFSYMYMYIYTTK